MLLNFVTAIGKTAFKVMFRRGVNRRSLVAFARNATGFVIAEQAIDLAANYSKWVEENRGLLLIAVALGSVAHKGFTKLRAYTLTKVSGKVLFSKISVRGFRSRMVSVMRACSYTKLKDGVRISLPGGEFLQIARDLAAKKLVVDHNGGPIAAGLLAAGLAGAAFSEALDWDATAEVLIAAASELHLDLLEAEAEEDIRAYDAISLMANSGQIARGLSNKYPDLAEERIAALIIQVMREEEHRVDDNYIICHQDTDGDIVYTVNGHQMMHDKKNKSIVGVKMDGVRSELPLEETPLGGAFLALLQDVSSDGALEFTPVPSTQRFVSPIYTGDKHALAFVWDQEKETLRPYVTSESLIDDAEKNMWDEIEASFGEEISTWWQELWADDNESAALNSKTANTVPVKVSDLFIEIGG